MVSKLADQAMGSVMYMMNELLWIPGHLRVVQDFLLFGRGDFAAVLYQNFNETVDGDAETLLLHSIKSVTGTKSYTNSITHECLTDRIDLQKKWSIQPLPSEVFLAYMVNPPIDAFLGREALAKYDLIGRLLWRLKCNECQLAVDWRNARRLQYLSKLGFDSRKLCFLRHLMFCFVRTIVEYLSTDVILCSWKDIEKTVIQCPDFDAMLDIHTKRLDRLMKGAFQTPQFSAVMEGLTRMLNTIGEFTSIEQELDGVYESVVRQATRAGARTRSAAFLGTIKKGLIEIMDRIKQVHAKFSGQLSEFYSVCFDDQKSVEMQYLENRLYYCVVNLA
jgi:hypothetical protein